jgi:Flp pilus assembly protein TadD
MPAANLDSTRSGGAAPVGATAARAAAPNSASVALLDQSRNARAAGELGQAAAALERALAIEPNNALLWIELAEVRAAAGDGDQADMLARKALTLAGNDRSVAERASRLMGNR